MSGMPPPATGVFFFKPMLYSLDASLDKGGEEEIKWDDSEDESFDERDKSAVITPDNSTKTKISDITETAKSTINDSIIPVSSKTDSTQLPAKVVDKQRDISGSDADSYEEVSSDLNKEAILETKEEEVVKNLENEAKSSPVSDGDGWEEWE
jgi:hypothetical protein